MILKMGFEINNLCLDRVNEIYELLENTLKEWCINENNRVGGKGFTTVASYPVEKSARLGGLGQ